MTVRQAATGRRRHCLVPARPAPEAQRPAHLSALKTSQAPAYLLDAQAQGR